MAFASDGIIIRALFEEGSKDGEPPYKPYKDRGYVIFPDGSNYLAGKTEQYAIAIANNGNNAGYAEQLRKVIDKILGQSIFQQEKVNLEKYETGDKVYPPDDRFLRNILLSILSIGVLAIILIFALKKSNNRQITDPRQVNGGINNIVNVVVGGQHINISNMSIDLAQASVQIQDLVEQFHRQGLRIEDAQRRVADDIAVQVQKSPTMADKLKKWGQALGDATVSDIAKEVVKLAIRTAGIPLP